MRKYRKMMIATISVIIVIIGLGVILYNTFVDENSLSISEQKWIEKNTSTITSLSIPNDIPVFGLGGEGVFFDFSDYLTNTVRLKINNNTISYNSNVEQYGFNVTTKYDSDNLLLYKDHFVVISKNTGILHTNDQVKSLTIGVLNNDSEMVKNYFNMSEESVKAYDNYSAITTDLNEGNISYAVVSMTEYKDELIKNNVNILYHISDLAKYYYLVLGQDKMTNSILTKEFNKWKKEKYEDSYNKNNYKLFIKDLGISSSEEDTLTSKEYTYGYIENRPYEIVSGSSYGGITAELLNSFERFSGVEFNLKKYNNSTDLAESAIKGNIDLYYNYYNIVTNFIDAGILSPIDYYVIAHNKVDLSLSNVNGLAYKTVYVMKDSYLYDLIKDIEGINIKLYASTNELKKALSKDSIILIDSNTYDYYLTNLSNNYSVRLKDTIDGETYSFRYKNDTDVFYKLFNAYTKTLDKNDLLRTGIINYNKIASKGKIVFNIAKYILIVICTIIIGYIVYRRKNKKVKLDTKVKKEDRLKYVDMLTSLKNRNYYNEKIKVWNKNKIYPQTIIVMDINNVKELNDKFGHEEGDKQILGVSNILIRTQIDNTEIIRTDGNEFMIYMVGYSEKQVVSYINKLRKEFKKELPYDFGVAVGFSMIEDDTKLIEDAFNEASITMRENKELFGEKDEKKD